MSAAYDVIVIGAGHNGLTLAAILAKRGLRVLVLERRDIAGGACVTEEIHPGFRASTAAYLVSLLQQRVVEELELERYGYRVDPKDPAFFSVYPDGSCFTMWRDEARTLEEIAKFSPRDAEAYPRYGQFVDRLARFKHPHEVIFVDALPRNALGKVLRFKLRQQLHTRLTAG